MPDKGHDNEIHQLQVRDRSAPASDFVLEKSIFSNIFEKDIRRVFIYKKAERLAKAIHLITPAFPLSSSLRNRIDAIAIGLVDGATLSPSAARNALSRELLALSSVLAIARTGALLSPMNADLIAREAHQLLQEIAAYEEPRLFLDEAPSLADLLRHAGKTETGKTPTKLPRLVSSAVGGSASGGKGHLSDIAEPNGRRDSVLKLIKDKGTVYIKDISTVIRDVSEKTIQRELQKLVREGLLTRTGSRRWTAYSLAS